MIGETIHLRALEPSDADTLFGWENDPATWGAGDRRWPVSLADIMALISHSDLDIWQTRQARFMVERNDGGGTAGCVDIFDFDPLNLNCSIGILTEAGSRRRGYAREAVSLACDFAAQTLLAHNVRACVAADNMASLALFSSVGFEECGRLREWLRRGRGFVDEVMMVKTLP